MRAYVHWTAAEDALLRQHYKTRGTAWCARALNVDVSRVWQRANRLKLSAKRGPQSHGLGRREVTATLPKYDATALWSAMKLPVAPPQLDEDSFNAARRKLSDQLQNPALLLAIKPTRVVHFK